MAKGKYQKWLEPEGLLLLEGWARAGLTDEQLARKIGISRDTLYDWKNKYSDISDALKKGKEVVDIQVENALLKRALGYDYQEERVEVSADKGRKVTQTLKHVPGDTTAQIFWLKNRRPDKWRDRPVPSIPEQNMNDNLLNVLESAAAAAFTDGDDSTTLPEADHAGSNV